MKPTLLTLGLVVLATGCDPSGIHGLGRLRDPLVPCEVDPLGRAETTSTWLRSTDDGTEIVLLGRADATDVVRADRPACFGHGFVAHDSSVRFAFGSYTLDGSGRGLATHELEYRFEHQPTLSLFDREGAVRTDLETLVDERLEIVADGTQILVSLDGTPMRMTSMADVVEALDLRTQAGAEDVFRLYNLPLFTSQARLLGFGSVGMVQYAGTTAEFSGAVRNRFTVAVASLLDPDTLISYYQLEDLNGIVVDGPQTTNVDTGGDGIMSGTLSFVMRGTAGATDVVVRGAVDYGALEIADGFAAGGTYTLTLDGIADPYVLSYQLATDVDLRAVLPVATP